MSEKDKSVILAEEIQKEIEKLLENDGLSEEQKIAILRKVMEDHKKGVQYETSLSHH